MNELLSTMCVFSSQMHHGSFCLLVQIRRAENTIQPLSFMNYLTCAQFCSGMAVWSKHYILSEDRTFCFTMSEFSMCIFFFPKANCAVTNFLFPRSAFGFPPSCEDISSAQETEILSTFILERYCKEVNMFCLKEFQVLKKIKIIVIPCYVMSYQSVRLRTSSCMLSIEMCKSAQLCCKLRMTSVLSPLHIIFSSYFHTIHLI